MKKFFLVLVALAVMSPSFSEEKKETHSGSDKKIESSEKKVADAEKKDASGKTDLSKKVDACLKERTDSKAK